ncbi:unnamed protein product [Paramecium pentaurelia]|uniref:Inositol 1,4,5-trisphosphate/ryanodine receptor domain-containing protein n=1 Tax=Paramecium pentaurelia TaxID=43138 RepID=A0A8S1XBU6_9CILI|nr:unnamed protein product [Paramecium pentaurelia]
MNLSLSFVAIQSCKKGTEHIKNAFLKIGFRTLKQNTLHQSEINRSPTLIQATSQYLGNKNGQEAQTQQREDFEQETKKQKQLTFLQTKVRSSTSPQQDIMRQQEKDEILDNEISDNQSVQKEIIKSKKKSFVQNKGMEKEIQGHRQSEHPYLKFGDVFVIKTNVSGTTIGGKQNETQILELIIIGNLQYSGSINCVNMTNQVINNPYSHQQKSFFTIRNPRTITSDQSYVCYGQRIVLVHSKSQQSVMINLDVPSQERGSFQVNLQSQIGHQNILRIMPYSSANKIGDKIQYNDQLLFQQDSNRQYYLKLEKDESRYSSNKFIDINASDRPDCFHLHKVKSHQNNIIQIIHQQSMIAIGTSEKQLQQFIINKNAIINNFNNDQQQQQQETFSLRTLDLNKYLMQDYEVQSSNLLNSYTYFEIQPLFPFTEQQASPNACKLKSLFTQQYLSVDPNDEKSLKLTAGYMQDDYSVFYFNPESTEQQESNEQIVSIQSSLGTYLMLTQNGKLQFQPLTNDQTPQLFSIKQIDSASSIILEDLNEIHMRILNFHVYLQQWSILSDKKKQNEDIFVFDYLKSLSLKGQLEQEVYHLQLQLEALSNHLSNKANQYEMNNNVQTSYIQKQKLLREQKILELLFSLLKLIDNIVFTQQKVFREKEKSRLYKTERALPSQQTASYVAFKALASIPVHIYKIILLSIKNNQNNRKIALDNDEFLCKQIRSYGPHVSAILREAVKDQPNIDLTDWVRLLEPLEEVGNNIYDMTIYLKIISIAMVDSSNQGIFRYQNKVCKELFSQGKNGKTKFLCQFNILLDKPTFNLYREEPLADFLLKNPSLNQLHLIRPSENNEMELFSLEELGEKILIKKSLLQFLSYLTASVNLLAQLCKGRNKKCMKKVQFLGITSNHIQNVIKSTQIPLSMKNSYLKLYEVLYIDIDPFLPIYSQTCFIWGQLLMEKDKKIAQIFNHYVEAVEVGKLTKEFEEKMLPLLLELLTQGNSFQEGLIKVKKKKMHIRLPSLSGNQVQTEKVEQKSKISQKIKFLTTLYHLIYKIIQLGYLTEEQICSIVKPMLQIFVPFLSQRERQALEVKENWLNELIGSAKSLQQQGLVDLIDELFSNAGLLFKQYFTIQLNVQIQEFLRHFQRSYQTYCLQSLEKLIEEVREIIMRMQLGQNKNLVLGYLLGFYCSNYLFQSKGFRLCQEALNQGVNQQWISQLRQAEIILDGDELELYQQLTGNSLVGQIFSPIRLEVQIQQLEDSQKKNSEGGGKQKDEKNWEIDNQLNKLINRIKEIKMDSFKLTKTQNILRNLGVHKQILRLIKAQREQSDTQQISIKFLCLFLLNNKLNCSEIQEDIFTIIQLASSNLKVSKLIGVFCQSLNDQWTVLQQLIKSIFATMHEHKGTCQQFYKALLSILQNRQLSQDRMNALKREILSNLFKIPSYINDLQYYKQFNDVKNKKEEQQFYGMEFQIFSASNALTAQVIKDYSLGIQQIQGILFTEQINQMIHNPAISYLIKSELIKLVYITQIQQIHTFTMQDMRELLMLLLNDLLAYPKYLDGLLKQCETNTEEDKEKIQKDKLQVDMIKQKMFQDTEEKKKNLLATTPGMPNQTNAAQQQVQQMNEQKRIVFDNTEYWKYFLKISNWQNIQFGVLMLLQQLFQEIQNRKWNISENQQNQQIALIEQINQFTEDSLYEPLALIKLILENIRQTLNLIETTLQYPKYRVYLAQLQHYISKCLMQCPLESNLKNFKTIKYAQEYKTQRAIKTQIKEYKQKALPKPSQDELKLNLNQFYEKLKCYMMEKHLTINEMMDKIKGEFQFHTELLISEGQYSVNTQDKLIGKDKFCNLFNQILDEHFQQLIQIKLSKTLPDISKYLTYEDASKYYESYMQLRDSTKNLLDINKFLQKLINYFDSQKIKYNKVELKELQKKKIQQKNYQQESLFIQQTYGQFIYQYELLINPDNPYNFYRLDKALFNDLQEQFLLKLSNDDEVTYIFSRLLKEEAIQQKQLALNIIYECLQRDQSIIEKDRLLHFCLKQIPFLMMYLEETDNEYTIKSIKKVKKTLFIFEQIQIMNKQQLATVIQNDCWFQFNKFISRTFNQVDRLFSLEQHLKQSTQSNDNRLFINKTDLSNEKNQLLGQFFKIIASILRLIGKLIQCLEVSSQFGDSANQSSLTEEVLYFTTNYFNYINRSQLTHICTETDILTLYTESFRCLNNFCEGNTQNQNLVFNHKPLIQIIQFVITTPKYDILADNLQDNNYRTLFKATIKLLLLVQLDLHQSYTELNFQILFEKLLTIYDTFAPRLQIIIQGQKCTHVDNINCTYLKCQHNLIAPGEFEVFTICFDLIILFNILCEKIDKVGKGEIKRDYWQTLKDRVIGDQIHDLSLNQKQNINFLRIYLSMKQFVKQQPFDDKRRDLLREYLQSNESVITSLEIKEHKQQQKINVKKKSTSIKSPVVLKKQQSLLGDMASPKSKLKESIYKITNKKLQVKQTLEEAIPFKKFEEQDAVIETHGKRESKMEQKLEEIAINWLEGAQQNNQRDIIKQNMCLKMAEAINFFSKYVGQIQIKRNDETKLQYFVLPFQSSFLLKQTTKKAKMLRMRRGRYEQLKTMSDYFQKEVIFRQHISMYPKLNWFSINIHLIKSFNYLLVLTLNICYLADLERQSETYQFKNQTVHIIVIILTIILILLSLFVLIIEIINQQPYIAFRVNYYREQNYEDNSLGFKGNDNSLNYIYPNLQRLKKTNQKKKIKMHQYFTQNRILAQITNVTFLYHLCYLVLAALSFLASPFISLLLFDIVPRVKGLKKVLESVFVNIGKIILIFYLALIVIHCYAFLAFLIEDISVFQEDQSLELPFITIFLRFFGNGFRLQNAFSQTDVYPDQQWGNYIFLVTFFLVVFIICFALIISIITGQYSHKNLLSKNQKNKSCKICNISYYQCREKNISWQEHIEKVHKLSAYLFFIICLQQKQELNYVEREIAKKLLEKDMSWLPTI